MQVDWIGLFHALVSRLEKGKTESNLVLLPLGKRIGLGIMSVNLYMYHLVSSGPLCCLGRCKFPIKQFTVSWLSQVPCQL